MVMRFGRTESKSTGIGTFGVGLNRALFKIGNVPHLSTDNGKQRSELMLKVDDYLSSENWELPAVEFTSSGQIGTIIEIASIPESIAREFADSSWLTDLKQETGCRYGRYLEKGLEIHINGEAVINQLVEIREDGPNKGDYKVYKTNDGISIHIKYGQHIDHRFTKEDGYSLQKNKTLSKEYGWTVLCNDRAIVINDQTYKTGWDTRFHTEFNGFVGYVSFMGPPEKLPWNTSKSDVDLNDPAYQSALVDMRKFSEKWRAFTANRKKHPEVALKRIPPKSISTRTKTSTPPSKTETTDKPVKKAVKKQNNASLRMLLPDDVDEAYCYDKHLTLVHEAKQLDIVDFPYSGMALLRIIFEITVTVFAQRSGLYSGLKDYAINKRSKKVSLTEAERKSLTPKMDEILPYLQENPDVWGDAKRNHLVQSMQEFSKHTKKLNGVMHNPWQQVNPAEALIIRDAVLPALRHLIEVPPPE